MIYFTPMVHALHWDWVKMRAAPLLCEDTCGIMAIRDTGDILAAAVFDSFTNTTCMVHLAIENPLAIRSGLLTEAANYLFHTRNRERIFGMTPSNNDRALKFNRHMGWVELYRVENAYDVGVDYVVQVITKADCKWLLDQPQKEAVNG